LLTAFPRELVVAIAGLALLGSIGGGLARGAEGRHCHREAALITFLVTLSGLTPGGRRARLSGAWSPAPSPCLCNSTVSQNRPAMNLLFVADPLSSFKTYKDTTFAMMRELQRRGHTLAACEPQQLQWQAGGQVSALVRRITLTGALDDWYRVDHQGREAVCDFDAVLMRKDPPFDSEYFYATHLLEQAEREGARVFNKPARAARPPGKTGADGVSRSSSRRPRW
jgi:hypothetical protein